MSEEDARLAYFSYYAGGFRAARIDESGTSPALAEVGHFIDEGGFELTDSSRELLAAWREPVKVAGIDQPGAVSDPTDPSHEPDLRRFEVEGDGPSQT